MPNFNKFAQPRQGGFVLVISLIFLVALVIYVIFAMRVANLGERVAGNAKQRNDAFYAAQNAIRRAELLILEREGNVVDNNGAALVTVTTVPNSWSAAAMSNANERLHCGLDSSALFCNLTGESAGSVDARWATSSQNKPQFRISRLRKGTTDVDNYYVITAIGYGLLSTTNAVVLQQIVRVNT